MKIIEYRYQTAPSARVPILRHSRDGFDTVIQYLWPRYGKNILSNNPPIRAGRIYFNKDWWLVLWYIHVETFAVSEKVIFDSDII